MLTERGPDAAGLKAVAAEAGVSHALVSHYFGTYDALVEEALRAHLTATRTAMIAEVETHTGHGPLEWIGTALDQYANPSTGRLLAWTILTGRLDSEDFFPRHDQGMRHVADAIEARLRRDLAGQAPDRETIEFAMILLFAAGLGYGVARQVLWGSFTKEATPERDAWFHQRLMGLLLALAPQAVMLGRGR